jgi:hypothetical protein
LTANTESSPQEIYAEMGHESINIASGKISWMVGTLFVNHPVEQPAHPFNCLGTIQLLH